MKVSDEKMLMAYAIGVVYPEHKEGNRKKIELADVNPKWEGYVINGNGYDNSNDGYALYYRGSHGREKAFVSILRVPEGWNLNHMVAMFIAAIQMHKSEVENNKKT